MRPPPSWCAPAAAAPCPPPITARHCQATRTHLPLRPTPLGGQLRRVVLADARQLLRWQLRRDARVPQVGGQQGVQGGCSLKWLLLRGEGGGGR